MLDFSCFFNNGSLMNQKDIKRKLENKTKDNGICGRI